MVRNVTVRRVHSLDLRIGSRQPAVPAVLPVQTLPAWPALLILLLASSALAGPGHVSVENSDASGIRFSVSGLQSSWTRHDLRGGNLVLHEVHLPAFVNIGDPGRPALPRRGGWLVVPPGTLPRVVVIAEKWADTAPRRLMVAATPVLHRDPETGEAYPVDEILLPGELPSSGGTLPPDVAAELKRSVAAAAGPVVSLGEIVPWRGRRIVSYMISPVQSDASGFATRILEEGTWEIRFEPDPQAGREKMVQGALRKTTRRGDERFDFLFLNGELLTRLPTEAASGLLPQDGRLEGKATDRSVGEGDDRARTRRRVDLLAPEVRLRVKRTQLYRVRASELQDRGLLPAAGIQEDQIRLYQRRYTDALADQSPPYLEVEVPIRMVGEGGAFDGDDFFLFYGLRPRDDWPYTGPEGDIPGSGDPEETYNEYNIYWLAAADPAGEPWDRMDVTSLEVAQAPILASYRRVDHFENDNYFREAVEDIDDDRNHWNSPFLGEVNATATIFSADPASSDAQLRCAIRGFANVYTLDRWLDISLVTDAGDTLLGAVNANRIAESIFTAPLTGAQLQDDAVDVHIEPQSTFPFLSSYLDWIEFSYDALYQASVDRLLFRGDDELDMRNIEVTGFTRGSLGLVEITDPHNPVWIALTGANQLDAGGGLWTLSIQVDQTTGRRSFFAQSDMTTDGVPDILYFRADIALLDGDPTQVAGNPDLVVVTHSEFRGAIDGWVSHRQSRAGGGLNVHVVEVQQLFDWYSGGLKDPVAIRRFATYAVDRWGSWALQIIGDGNENARELGLAANSPRYYNDPSDWVPTHLHVQDLGISYQPELLMSDKWFVSSYTGDYPDDAGMPTQMYVGRFPCNTVADLDVMIDKVIAYEPAVAGSASWRRKGIFLADDAWSYGYENDAGRTMRYWASERAFQVSEDSLASRWERAGLEAVRMFLADFLDPWVSPPDTTIRNTNEFRNIAYSEFWPVLFGAFSDGATVVHYQGHANMKVMAHEYLMQDESGSGDRRDVDSMNNGGRPWIFFGMGCHIADWGQNTVRGTTIVEPSLGEKFLLRPGGGGIAVYASSGYEFLSDNRVFSELTFDRWLLDPPTQSVGGADVRSRWLLGELMWASEADLLAYSPSVRYRRVVAQYSLLGDALMMLDCQPPSVAATLTDAGGQAVNDQDVLDGLDAGNVRTLELATRDVAGVDRLVIRDSAGADLSGNATEVLPPGASNHQEITYEVDLPIHPFDHTVTFHVFDTANRFENDSHYELTVLAPQSAEFSYENGDPAPAGQIPFPAGLLLTLRAVVQSAADLSGYAPQQMTLTGEGLDLSGVQIELRDGEPHVLDLTFTAKATEGTEPPRSIILAIDVFTTEYVLQEGDTPVQESGISQLYAFPSPMRDQTRFVFDSGTVASGRIQIFTVAGTHVVDLPVSPGDFSSEGAVVPWDGRDERGDELANGVYLYRVELDGPNGKVTSDGMQRLVVMR